MPAHSSFLPAQRTLQAPEEANSGITGHGKAQSLRLEHLWHPPVPTLCSKQGQWPRNVPRCLLGVSRDENTTNSMGNSIQCSAIHMKKKDCIYISMEFPGFPVVPVAPGPVTRHHWESLVFAPHPPGCWNRLFSRLSNAQHCTEPQQPPPAPPAPEPRGAAKELCTSQWNAGPCFKALQTPELLLRRPRG